MKNLFKTSKRSIAAILTLCILLGIAGTCVYATSAMPEENPTATEETIVAANETTQELVPVMATRCGNVCAHDLVYKYTAFFDGKYQALWECDCGRYSEWMPVN